MTPPFSITAQQPKNRILICISAALTCGFSLIQHSIALYLSFLITVVKVSKLRLIWLPSFNLAPSALVWEARSLPARSTRFYPYKIVTLHLLDVIYTHKKEHIPNWPRRSSHGLNFPWAYFQWSGKWKECCNGTNKFFVRTKILTTLTSLMIWCDLELLSLREVSPTCLCAAKCRHVWWSA